MKQFERRGSRKVYNSISIKMDNLKDLLKARLIFEFAPKYSEFTNDQKQAFWKQKFDLLLQQNEKILYWLPDKYDQKDIRLAIDIIDKFYTANYLLDYEYEKTFVGSEKKQLLVYRQCRAMDEYLMKYRLPNDYEQQIKKVQKSAQILSQAIIQRNQFISFGQYEKVEEISQKIQGLTENFDKSFETFSILMQKIFAHFKQQLKRSQILLIAIRQSIIEKLKELALKNGLFLSYRFSETEGDQFKDILIKKHKEYSNDQNDIKSEESAESSFIESSFESDEELEILPPRGIGSVELVVLQEKILSFRVILLAYGKRNRPETLVITEKISQFSKQFSLTDTANQEQLNFDMEYSKNGFVEYIFSTKNAAGCSQQNQSLKLCLRLEDDLSLSKNRSVYLIQGLDTSNQNGILPKQKILNQQNGFKKIAFPSIDLSISAKSAMICDAQGSVATWGAIYTCLPKEQQQEKILELSPETYTFNIESPFLLVGKQKRITKISCGFGYSLLLDIFGNVFSFGLNNCGQLGCGAQCKDCIQEPEIIKTFQKYNSFIVDIKATESGASFAIDSNGMMYRWGTNQVKQSLTPVIDRFGSIINYSTDSIILKQYIPIPVKKNYSNQKIVKIVNGNQFYFSLNSNGDLYGWGQCLNLGIGILYDKNEEEVQNICNPLQIMKEVANVSSGQDHTIVILKDGSVKGWGNMKYILNQKNLNRQIKPIDITSSYENIGQNDVLECGKTYTVVCKQKEIKILGEKIPFEKRSYTWGKRIQKVVCSDNYLGILTEHQISKDT